ncbi:MAG TPA: glycosyltransferase [Anaerohalosphaeraceae bacterium]|nr:glycosyltransferase [Anaerohalosphaeraceae bacterium]HOL89096.1 glycosyltransferase [Anaerohalosphaeraceae bacterium]
MVLTVNLLVLSNNPERASYRERIGVYLKRLADCGVVCQIERIPPSYRQRWRLFREAARFDGVLIHKKTLNMLDARILRKNARRILYDFDDAVMYNPQQPDKKWTGHFRLFRRTVKMADCVIAGNSYLAEQARPFCKNVHILPTGLDGRAYESQIKKPQDGKIRLVWIGSRSTLRYLEEIKPALEKIGQENPSVILRIIADQFLDCRYLPVEKSVWSLNNQAQMLQECDIGLAPLPDNSFTRGKCGFKILQYFAAGLPVIVSPVGVNHDFVEESGAGFSASTLEQWHQAVRRLISNEPLRKDWGQKARAYVQRFDHRIIGEQFCRIVLNALRG